MEVSFVKDEKRSNPLLEKGKVLIDKIKNWKIPSAFYYFLILMAVGVGFYMMMLIENNFSLAYGGDYTGQYIPMGFHVWDYYHEWINTGHFTLFDPTIYLGVNSIGSNAYYGLFSPFNLIIVILPRSFVPQSLAICSIVKLACAGLFFSIYMKHAFKVKDIVARMCGVAYAFAGWGAFYLWYNNYQDILVFFPLVLLGIEKVLQEYKPWVLITGVFFLAICNYVLTIPYLICGFIYAMFRFFQMIRTKTFANNMKTLGIGFIGFAGGLLMSMFVFGPAVMATLSSPKLDSYSYFGTLKGYLTSGKIKEFFTLLFSWNVAPDQHSNIIPKRVFYPILEFFFPATTCRSLPTLQMQNWDFDDMAVSLWCYIPFIMFLVPALIQSGREKKWSHFIAFVLLVVSLFTPFMYFLTMGFTNGYARWTLFIATSLIAYVGIYLNKIPNVARWHIHLGFLFAIIGIIAAWVLTYKLTDPYVDKHSAFMHRLVTYDRYWRIDYDFTNLAFILELVYTLTVYLILFFFYYKKAFHILGTIFVSFEAIVMGNFVTWGHGFDKTYNNGYEENERFKSLYDKVTKGDNSFYRIFSSIDDDWSVNNSFMNNYNSAGYFHSLYNFEVNDFTLWTGLRSYDRAVGGNYRGKHQDLDNLLGVKYYFISKKKSKYSDIEKNNPNGYMANVPFDFTECTNYDRNKSDYIVYENKIMNAFGSAYSNLYTGEYYKWPRYTVDNIRNEMALNIKASVSEEDGEEITNLYGDAITVDDVKAKTTTLKLQTEASNYNYYFYDVWANTANHTLAKNYLFEKIPTIPEDPSIPITDYYRYDASGRNKAQDYYIFFTSKWYDSETNKPLPLFKAGTTLYIHAPFSGSEKYDFYFIDENNKIFMYDAHDDDTTDNTSYMRGFYIKRDVYRIAMCGKYGESFMFNENNGQIINFYTEDQSIYEARRDALNAEPITDVFYKKDYFSFKTNYSKNKFVVSRVAYDRGWKITATEKATGKTQDLKIYKGNGGFISFVAPTGEYSYKMTYQTPYLTISYLVTALATTSFFVSMVGYHIYQNKKRQDYLDDIHREN